MPTVMNSVWCRHCPVASNKRIHKMNIALFLPSSSSEGTPHFSSWSSDTGLYVLGTIRLLRAGTGTGGSFIPEMTWMKWRYVKGGFPAFSSMTLTMEKRRKGQLKSIFLLPQGSLLVLHYKFHKWGLLKHCTWQINVMLSYYCELRIIATVWKTRMVNIPSCVCQMLTSNYYGIG